MKNIILTSALSSALLLSGCGGGGDDAAQVIADEFISISGKISNLADTGEPGVGVEGVYSSPGGLLNPATTTDSSGNFSLQVLKNDAVFLRATKDSFATINSAKAPLSANVSGLDIGMPTEDEAQDVIDAAFTSMPVLLNHAWLVVDIEDANGDGVSGQTITSTISPSAKVYTKCDGTDSGVNATTACPSGRLSPMYIAYFDTAGEASVTVGSETRTAPIRMGEITALEFTVAAGPFTAGQLKYDADCASCHGAGSYDPVSGASDLYNDGDQLVANISSYAPGQKSGVVADLTAQEILDLTAFLDDPSIAP